MSKLLEIIRFAFDEDPSLERLLAALPQRTAGGTAETGAQMSVRRWIKGQPRPVASDTLARALRGPLKQVAVDAYPSIRFDWDNVALLCTRTEFGLSTQLIIVARASPEGPSAVFDCATENEWFKIANSDNRFPVKRLPAPVGLMFDIGLDGTIGDVHDTLPPEDRWIVAPVAWKRLPGVNVDMEDADKTISGLDGLTRALAGPGSENRLLDDPVAEAVADAVAIYHPSLRVIRRFGVDDGFRGKHGEVVE